MAVRSSNYDRKGGLYDTPGLTTFGFDDVLFHKDIEKKYRIVDDWVQSDSCKCKSICAIF
jgi:putative ribosome biogenesis GTPase RsgA